MGERTAVKIDRCRSCGGDQLVFLLTLGTQFVSDFVPADRVKAGVKCPITLVLCVGCGLVQQEYTAPQDFMYTRHYWYRSGTTKTMRDALYDVVESACERTGLRTGDLVLDIGANDGTLLSHYQPGVTRVGVEPAKNLAESCKEFCDVFIPDFWSAEAYYDYILQKKAKIVTACGMFYDLDDPNKFIGDVAKVLHPEGVFVAQLMCLKQTLAMRDVGNLAHEHLEFYSLRSLDSLFSRHGLAIFDVDENAVNGGSYRLYVAQVGARRAVTGRAAKAYASEVGYDKPRLYRDWIIDCERNRAATMGLLRGGVAAGEKVWVYGASTKGNVILQWYGLDSTLVQGAVDKSPEKRGLYTVGTGIPIYDETHFRLRGEAAYAVVLPYAFLPEFVEREKEQHWRRNGGKFVVPLPEVRLV